MTSEEQLRDCLAFILCQVDSNPGARLVAFATLKRVYPDDFPDADLVAWDRRQKEIFETNLKFAAQRDREKYQ